MNNHFDSEQTLFFHHCPQDRCTMIHDRNGSLIEYYRDRNPNAKTGASIVNRERFDRIAREIDDEICLQESFRTDPFHVLIAGTLIGLSASSVIGMLVYLLC